MQLQRALLTAAGMLFFLSACTPLAIPARAEAAEAAATPTSIRIVPIRTSTPSPTPSRTPTQTPTRTATPAPTNTQVITLMPALPTAAEVKDMFGFGQLLPLSCESRAAADWARHFGIKIRELEFFSRIPVSKNPEEGFVGSVNGSWGQIPPEAYGVHAGPVAKVLQSYGAQATAVRHMTLDALRAEIAAGRPVIVWVTGHVEAGRSVPYTVDGKIVIVARYEHTVIVTGYDEKNLTILDGKKVYKRGIDTFLKAWSPLQNQAIIWK